MGRSRIALAIGLLLLAGPATAQDRPAPSAEGRPGAPAGAPAAPAGVIAIETGSSVRIDYTLKDDAGAVLDSTKDREPLSYTHGKEEILAGLERELTGLHVGDEKKVTLKPEDAYGAVNPDAKTDVRKEMLPAGALVVGTRLMARNPAGATRQVMVKEIKDKTVTLDMNHPLAGKTLVFEVKIVEVKPPAGAASPPEAPKPGAPPSGATPGR